MEYDADYDIRNYVSLADYAKIHNISYTTIWKRALAGKTKTAVMLGGAWLINKNEAPAAKIANSKLSKQLTTKLFDLAIKYTSDSNAHKSLINIIKDCGLLSEFNKYCGKDEVLTKNIEDYTTLNNYAKLHKCSLQTLYDQIEQGRMKTATKIGGIWMINKNETLVRKRSPQTALRLLKSNLFAATFSLDDDSDIYNELISIFDECNVLYEYQHYIGLNE